MEHKLIQGGEQYLPFARSRIKALRASGLQYATQRFDMGDALVEVAIKLDQDYITISGGKCTLAMDSGVVDVLAIAPLAPESYKPGIMHETFEGAAYNAAFTLPQGGGDWLLNPSKDSNTQLAGILSGSKTGEFKGKLPVDKAMASSFTPRPELSNSTVPATWVQAKHDEVLWIKKLTAVLCPASIFTGRTRLYVQALYGRHLYTRKGDKVTSDNPGIDLLLGSPPRIAIPSYRRPGDTADYVGLNLNTSTGVHLDTVTGTHWLMAITAEGIQVFPLVGDPCAESMRKFLVKPYPKGLPVLSDETLEKLEAYILSRCLPDRKNVQLAPCTLGMSFYSMGYGWHWNWSGTQADIVVSDAYQQYPDADQPSRAALRAMISSHHRVSVSPQRQPDVDGVKMPPIWVATLTDIETNKRWYINRALWVIAEPNMETGTLFKTTPRWSELFESEGPFYAFYTGDELVMCRSKFQIHQPDPPTHSESDDLYHGEIPGSIGERPGYARDTDGGSEYYSCTITCGAKTTDKMLWGHVKTASNSEFSKRITTPLFGPRYSNSDNFHTQSYPFGYPPYQTSEVIPDAIINTSFVPVGDHDIDTHTIREEWDSGAVVVVPFYDAEAVYLNAGQTKTTTKQGVIAHFTYGWFGEAIRVSSYNSPEQKFNPPVYFTTYSWKPFGPQNGFAIGNTSINEVQTEQEIDVKSLICKAGVVQLDRFDGTSQLQDPEADEASGNFTVLSGASTRHPVVIAHKKDQPIGVEPGAFVPVMVGYI